MQTKLDIRAFYGENTVILWERLAKMGVMTFFEDEVSREL